MKLLKYLSLTVISLYILLFLFTTIKYPERFVAIPDVPLTATVSDQTETVILDTEDISGITLEGSWTTSSTASGYNETNYLTDNNTDKGNKSVTFTPSLELGGDYKVYLNYPAYSNRATNVPVDIQTTTGLQTVTVNQTQSGAWKLLGTYTLDSSAYVKIRTTGTTNYVIADAVKFVSESSTPPEPPPTPTACTSHTYTPWTPTTCPASGTQTRTVTASTPTGCTGGVTPDLTKSCIVVVPPEPPPTPTACTSHTYTAWTPTTCPASGTQTRTVTASTPTGCTGGVSPDLTKSCNVVLPDPLSNNNKVELKSNSGTVLNTFATIQACANVATAGQTCLVWPGVYRESVTVKKSGTADAPITFKSKELNEAVIDGSEPLNSWTKCLSATECLNNTNWSKMYYHPYAETYFLFRGVLRGDSFLGMAQYPNQDSYIKYDNIKNFISVAKTNVYRNVSANNTVLIDAVNFCPASGDDSCLPNYFDESYVLFWRNPNLVEPYKILSYSPSEHKITFQLLDADDIYTDRDSKYAIYNQSSSKVFDKNGEYFVDSKAQRVYLITDDITEPIYFTKRRYGMDLNNQSYIEVSGFKFQKIYGQSTSDSIGVGNVYPAKSILGLKISDNEVTLLRHLDKGYGGIYLKGCYGCIIEDNYIHDLIGTYSIFAVGGDSNIIQNNEIYNADAITAYGGQKLSIINNSISGDGNAHSNSITVYDGAKNILIAGNKIIRASRVAIGDDSSNIAIVNNIIDAQNNSGYIIQQNGAMSGYVWIMSNAFLGSSNNTAILLRSDTTRILKNNISCGAGSGIRRYNLYTCLSWNQTPAYGWTLGEGELVVKDLNKIFVNSAGENYSLAKDSPAINAGVDINSDLVEIKALFPGYDFNEDMLGRARGNGGAWDIGPYEYQGYTTPPPTPTCTDSNWTNTLTPTTCPVTRTQTKTWTKVGTCTGGVTHPATEPVTCTPGVITCTTFTYTNWSTCSGNSQTRTVLTSLPTNCTGGTPVLTQSCTTSGGGSSGGGGGSGGGGIGLPATTTSPVTSYSLCQFIKVLEVIQVLTPARAILARMIFACV